MIQQFVSMNTDAAHTSMCSKCNTEESAAVSTGSPMISLTLSFAVVSQQSNRPSASAGLRSSHSRAL